MKKIISLLLSMFLTITAVNAESISKTIKDLGVNKSAISVSIKDVKTGDVVYELNEKTPMLPASTLKLLTSVAAYDTLGKNFVYSTRLYKSTNNDLHLQLVGDPLLTSNDLTKLIETAKSKNIAPKGFYIDDTAFDKNEWGEGWQWDDDLNPLMPKFSVFNIDKNMIKIEVAPTVNNAGARVTVKPFYPVAFMNHIVTDYSQPNNIKFDKNGVFAPNMLNAAGTVSRLTHKTIPAQSPKMNFVLRLEEAIRNKKLEYFGLIGFAQLPKENIYLVDEAEHLIDDVIVKILKSSDNLAAETLFKTSGAVWAGSQGSIENSLGMLNSYLSKIGINSEDIKVVDGSGVSKNNIMTADFMSNLLVYIANNEEYDDFRTKFSTPGEGTLKNRMLYFKDNLRAKTGTLSDASAIAGYITSRKGKLYAFDIMINDAKTSPADKKNIEEQILRNIYTNY